MSLELILMVTSRWESEGEQVQVYYFIFIYNIKNVINSDLYNIAIYNFKVLHFYQLVSTE